MRSTHPGIFSGARKTVSRVLYQTVIYLGAPLPTRSSHLPEAAGPACCFHHGVAPDGVYSDARFPGIGCALTAPFHPYPTGGPGGDAPVRRYISVALFLKLPSAGVTRYPCPVEPGLSSWTAFRPAHATVCFPRDAYCKGWGRNCQPSIHSCKKERRLRRQPGPPRSAAREIFSPRCNFQMLAV